MSLSASLRRSGWPRAQAAGPQDRHAEAKVASSPWDETFARRHGWIALAGLAGALGLSVVSPASLSSGPAVLLAAGALIGVPHGSSDFVVAHRRLAPRWRAWWLPAFLGGYLLVVAAMLIGWRVAPGSTFGLFLVVSAFHFGAGPWDARHPVTSLLQWSTRALTPVLPIFMFHRAEVGGILSLLGGLPRATIDASLEWCHAALVWPYLALVALATALILIDARRDGAQCLRDAAEAVLLVFAAWRLPPYLTFAIYFCGLHAVRHVADLASARHPADGRAALALASKLLVPSALACVVGLAVTWNVLAGWLNDTAILCVALRLVAALTVPHVMLECWADRADTVS